MRPRVCPAGYEGDSIINPGDVTIWVIIALIGVIIWWSIAAVYHVFTEYVPMAAEVASEYGSALHSNAPESRAVATSPQYPRRRNSVSAEELPRELRPVTPMDRVKSKLEHLGDTRPAERSEIEKF